MLFSDVASPESMKVASFLYKLKMSNRSNFLKSGKCTRFVWLFVHCLWLTFYPFLCSKNDCVCVDKQYG